ncbi:hypothetical protein KP803_10545 [Vibrio sp. ZSDE26]|uniref:Uncharacterized protein n=1 Tax=Vibrio amylolyticus TaxID=2847292 RepID=A0A9X1XJR7_9VIBR|nr:hypothetical protein [Vibrio amylolyticus]MCK6263711.1 hypothetical protein [Vibrio amylolyticus]
MNNTLVLENNVLESNVLNTKEEVRNVMSRRVKEILAIAAMYSVTALIVLATSLTWVA